MGAASAGAAITEAAADGAASVLRLRLPLFPPRASVVVVTPPPASAWLLASAQTLVSFGVASI